MVESLLLFVKRNPAAMQYEMIRFLQEEFDTKVQQGTISKLLKKDRQSRKLAQRISPLQNERLRQVWIADLLNVTAEQLVFIDESMFNESTGWRHYAYAPIGQAARYQASRRRGKSWSVLPAYTIDGYLPCTGFKLGWFSGEQFMRWIRDELLPYCSRFPGPKSVIVMDNASFHCHPEDGTAIEEAGCEVRYLPPYSPDFNPIELSFSVLKAWIRRHFDSL
jgi:hypothetical protein